MQVRTAYIKRVEVPLCGVWVDTFRASTVVPSKGMSPRRLMADGKTPTVTTNGGFKISSLSVSQFTSSMIPIKVSLSLPATARLCCRE
jgi:hypothetical protein